MNKQIINITLTSQAKREVKIQKMPIKETSLAEITLRKYEKPSDLQEIRQRDLIKKVCLSLGLLQEADSRDVVTDILQVLLENSRRIASLTPSGYI